MLSWACGIRELPGTDILLGGNPTMMARLRLREAAFFLAGASLDDCQIARCVLCCRSITTNILVIRSSVIVPVDAITIITIITSITTITIFRQLV